MRHPVLAAAVLAPALSLACSCFGPQTFCETMAPPYPEPQWWVPDNIILAVKEGSVAYGADVRVVQTFSGTLVPGAVVRVWGDCGLLCRHYVDGVADGDTVLWAIQDCDLSGNGGCGTSLESPTDHQLSICGVYWLSYANGVVSGPLLTEGATESMTLAEFDTFVDGCLATSVPDPGGSDEAELLIRNDRLHLVGGSELREAVITAWDLTGRALFSMPVGPGERSWTLPAGSSAVLLVELRTADRRLVRRLLRP